MTDPCKHTNAVQADHADSGAHIGFCPDCRQLSHVCFKPLYDHIEKGLEKIRVWGVHYSKADGRRASESVAVQREVESILAELREAMLMARATKNAVLEEIAGIFERRGQQAVGAEVRDLKLEVSLVHDEPEKSKVS